MSFTASTAGLLEDVERFVAANLETGWAAEPPAARAALLVREELRRWTGTQYPGSTSEESALDAGSRRRLLLTIHSAPVSHRVEIWGMAPGDDLPGAAVSGHTAHSWVVIARVGGPDPAVDRAAAKLKAAGLQPVGERRGGAVALSLWMGRAAPDGCPDCKP